MNWYVPHFLSVGQTTSDIQLIQLDDGGAGMVGWGDSMQIVGPGGNPIGGYFYWDKSMAPEEYQEQIKNACYWANEDMSPAKTSFDQGEGIAFDNGSELEFNIVNSGEVIKEQVSFAAQGQMNWTGNPFAAPVSIQAVSLDDGGAGMVGWGDSMQIVGPGGNPIGGYFYWDKSMAPEEYQEQITNPCYWANEDMSPADKVFEPGEGFALDNGSELEFNVKIACPYSL